MTDQVDLKFRLMEYHRGAMEVRRSILFKGFLALITFDLVLGKAAPELIKPSLGSCNIKLLFTLLIVVAWGCYYWFAFETQLPPAKAGGLGFRTKVRDTRRLNDASIPVPF